MAVVSVLASDWMWFFIGRSRGQKVLNSKPALKEKANKIHDYLNRHKTLILLGYRFIYGFRIVIPLIVGMGNIRVRKFILFSVIGALAWAIIIALAGYFFGQLLESQFGRLKHYEIEVLVTMLAIGALIYLIRKLLFK